MSRRILAELKKLGNFTFEGNIDIEVDEGNVSRWEVSLKPPGETVYCRGVFLLKILFPPDYPHCPPELVFDTPIYHPNISKKGLVCLGVLKGEGWSPQKSMVNVFQDLFDLLKNPNPEDPLEINIAREYISNRELFRTKAMQHVVENALP